MHYATSWVWPLIRFLRARTAVKLKDVNFSPIIQENPVSTRDQLMKECWHEIKGLPKPIFENVWQGPIEVRLEELKVKMDKFEVKAEKLKAEYLEEQKKKADSEAAKAEKKKLQVSLRTFEKEFEEREKRKVKFVKDIAPIAHDYARYKDIKSILRDGKE